MGKISRLEWFGDHAFDVIIMGTFITIFLTIIMSVRDLAIERDPEEHVEAPVRHAATGKERVVEDAARDEARDADADTTRKEGRANLFHQRPKIAATIHRGTYGRRGEDAKKL